ncbi:MAG: GntR family transcriptional regulator [bacterium]
MFSIQTSSDVPIYLQLIRQVEEFVTTGVWQPGDAVPSVRQVAQDLAINPMTVSKAYARLESMGLLRGQKGKRMTVGLAQHTPRELLAPAVLDLVAEAQRLEVTPAELTAWLIAAWDNRDV